MKDCGVCAQQKTEDLFSKNKNRPDGLSWNCRACVKKYKAAYHATNRDALVQKQRDAKAANPERVRASNLVATARYYQANKAARAAYARSYYARSKDRSAANLRAWRAANPHQVAAWKSGRRSAERQPCGWADKDLIKDLYALARIYRQAGIACHVDHIVPLTSRLVCGLHTHSNLSLVSPTENSSKGNRRWPDMP